MRVNFDYDFLLLEFKDLHHSIKSLEDEDEPKAICSKIIKILQHIIITIHLYNRIFYNSENSLIENIRYLSSKDILPYELMKKLLNYIGEISKEQLKINKKEDVSEDMKIIYKEFFVIYELIVWFVVNCGEEDYSLFYDNLSREEKIVFEECLFAKGILGKSNNDKRLNIDEEVGYFDIGSNEDNEEDIEDLEDDKEDCDIFENGEEYLLAGELYYLGKNVDKDYFKAREYFEMAAEQGNEYAEGYLALFYEKGFGGEKNIDKALEWYKKAAMKGNAFSQYSLGYIYFSGEEVEQNLDYSFEWYKKAAENEFAPAQYALSYLYKNGEGCEKNIFKAYYWLEEAAENGFEDAYYILGQSYLEGNNIDINYKKAFLYLSKGAEKGDINCLDSLGDMYYFGFYVDEDRENAFELYKESIENGNIELYYKVGKLYEEDNNIELALVNYLKGHNNGDLKSTQRLGIMYFNGEGVKKDKQKSLEYMKIAATDGDAHSLYVLGVAYLEESREKGFEYLKKAYENGSAYAAEVLASELLIDVFNEKDVDEKEVLEYIEYAMENEIEEAVYYYGLLYAYGVGVTKNNEEAFKYFILAAEQGSQKAMIKLGNWYKHGIFVKANIKEAISWYKKAAKEYNVEALMNIIEIYELGIGIKKDYHKAYEGALLLREANIVEGDLKLAYYNIVGIGVEKNYEAAEDYINEVMLLDLGKTMNFIGTLVEEGLYKEINKMPVEDYYLRAIHYGSTKAYSNLEYYLYKNNSSISDYTDKIGDIKKSGYWIEQGKSVYVSGIKLLQIGKEENNKVIMEKGIKILKKSIHLGFYKGINDIITYYEEAKKTKKNLLELYKYKQKKIYYNV
ncbi:hypothetical protein JCM1393_08180 [Clostridium carnis]